MSVITQHIGKRIRKSRKSKGLTIDEFSKMINKSKATVSKYENGTIAIDIDTLLDIADVLDMELKSLIDYNSPNVKPTPLPSNSFFNQPIFYLYYYDGRIKDIVRAQMHLSIPSENANHIEVILYIGLETFNNTEKCQHIFEGEMKPYDTITHVNLTNQINATEKLYMCILNPMHAHSPAVGIMSGIASNPFFAPIAFKILISKRQLVEDAIFKSVIELNKEDNRNFKYYNMMIINRPSSLFLNEK